MYAQKREMKVKDGKEYVINEFLKLQVPSEIEEAINWIFDDYEYAQDHGVFYSYDDDLSLIDIDNMLECLEDRILEAREEDNFFILNIKDTGVGLDEKYWQQVFEPLESDPDDKIYKNLKEDQRFSLGQGSGIGLTITKDIVEKYGGIIYFKVPEKGFLTEIEVKIPCQ